jgi:hypothetical protein
MTTSIRRRTSVVVDGVDGDAPNAHRTDSDAGRSDQAMNTLANLYVNLHLQDLLDEAAKERLRLAARPARRSWIASAMSSIRLSIGGRPVLAA